MHWIRARKMLEADDLMQPSDVWVEDDIVVVQADGQQHRFGNHAPDQVARALEQTSIESVRFTQELRGLLVDGATFGLEPEPEELGSCGDGEPNGAVSGFIPVDGDLR